MFRTAIVAILCVYSWSLVNAEELPSPESVLLMLERTGTVEIDFSARKELLPPLQKVAPGMPDAYWEEFMSESSSNELRDLTVGIYQKHLTQSDIDSINSFYESEAGKKLLASQSVIVLESSELGKAWGRKVVTGVMEKFKELNP